MVRALKGLTLATLTFCLGCAVWAQTNAPPGTEAVPQATGTVSVPGTNTITFPEFLREVAAANLDYAAARYNVPIAEAAVAAAREFQNPTLALNGGRDVTHRGSQQMPATAGASLTQTLELGGKRKYRILGARQNQAGAAATLESFWHNLRCDAAAAFAEALASARLAEEKRQSAEYLAHLLQTQRDRRQAGDISQADLLQTQVEEQQFRNEVLTAQSDAETAAIALSGFLGRDRGQTLLVARGSLELAPEKFELPQLVSDALQRRADLLALRHARDAAQSNIRLQKANRIPNVDVGLGWTRSTESQNSISPSPAFDSVGLTFSLPLPLWTRNRAGVASATYTAEQAQKQLESAELKLEVQVRQAFSAYQSAVERVRHYQNGILQDAESVLAAKRYSYEHGQAALLELISAQRTANDVRSSYNEALATQAKSLIELERAAQFWQLNF